MYYHDHETLVHTTYASRTIEEGEEISITYIDLLQRHDERAETLQQIWGFKCACSLCTGSKTKRQASEARVHKINTLQSILGDWYAESIFLSLALSAASCL